MVFVTAAIGLGSLAAGWYSSEQNKKNQQQAFSLNQRQYKRGRRQFKQALADIDEAELESLAEIDAANELLASIEPTILDGMDETLRLRVASQIRREQEQNEALNARMMAQGLDASVVAGGVQRGQRIGQAQSASELAAGFAARRAQALVGARQLEASGLQMRSNVIGNYANQRANLRAGFAGYEGGFQYAPAYDGTAEAFGNAVGALTNAYQAFDAPRHETFQPLPLAQVDPPTDAGLLGATRSFGRFGNALGSAFGGMGFGFGMMGQQALQSSYDRALLAMTRGH